MMKLCSYKALAVVSLLGFSSNVYSGSDQTNNSLTLPLVNISSVTYEGGFRLPSGQFGESNRSTHSYSTGPIAFNPANNSLYTISHDVQQGVGEFRIPKIVKSDNPRAFNTATVLQNFRPFHENGSALTGINNFFRITGMALANNKLIVNYMSWYDAPGTETDTTVVFQTPNDLANSNIIGPFQLDGAAHAAGWLTPIPQEWRNALGGDHIAGHAHGSIASRLSIGPPAHILKVSDLTSATQGQPISTFAALDFSLSAPLYDKDIYDLETTSREDIAYNVDGQNKLWTQITGASFGMIIPGTGTYMTLGFAGGFHSGLGYKITQSDGNVCGGPCSYDPDDVYNHYWLWKVSDMVKVKNGVLAASDLRPYKYGVFDTRGNKAELKGAAYDPATKRLYVSLQRGDTLGTYARPPLILTYLIDTKVAVDFLTPVIMLLDD